MPRRQDLADRVSSIFFALVTDAVNTLAENVRRRLERENPHDWELLNTPPWGKVTGPEREKAVQILISQGEKDRLDLGRARWACDQAIYIPWRSRYDQQRDKNKANNR